MEGNSPSTSARRELDLVVCYVFRRQYLLLYVSVAHRVACVMLYYYSCRRKGEAVFSELRDHEGGKDMQRFKLGQPLGSPGAKRPCILGLLCDRFIWHHPRRIRATKRLC